MVEILAREDSSQPWKSIAKGKDLEDLWRFRTALRVAAGFGHEMKWKEGEEEIEIDEKGLKEVFPAL